MQAWSPGQGVAPAEGVPVVSCWRYRHAGSDGVTTPQKGPEVGFVGHPQRGDDQVVEASLGTATSLIAQFGWLFPGAGRHERRVLHSFGASRSKSLIGSAFGGARGPSTRRDKPYREGDALSERCTGTYLCEPSCPRVPLTCPIEGHEGDFQGSLR